MIVVLSSQLGQGFSVSCSVLSFSLESSLRVSHVIVSFSVSIVILTIREIPAPSTYFLAEQTLDNLQYEFKDHDY